MKFVLVGDDFPVAQMLKLLREFEQVQVLMLFTSLHPEQRGKVQAVTEEAGVQLYDSHLLRGAQGRQLLSAQPFDWLVNINSTVLLPRHILELPRLGALNMHPGLLPEYAGLHTHQWAIRNGEQTFGITIHFMDPKVDTGDIVLQRRFSITPEDTGLSLFYKCIREGTQGMRQVLRDILAGRSLPRLSQDSSKYHLYRHRDALDGRIDWGWTARQIEDFVRAGNYGPFTSPTYTACLDSLNINGQPVVIQVLKVNAQVSPIPAALPGTVYHPPDASMPPWIICGAQAAVSLQQARREGEKCLLSPAGLRTCLAQDSVLRGRQA